MCATTVARLACDEATARLLAAALGESVDADNTVCGAFEADGGQWQVAIHFRTPPDEAAVRALVALAADDKAAAALTFERIADADWVAQSLAGLAPVRAGRFVVHGAHDRAKVPANATAIEIEAALAFGTGHHGTTRGCLLALDGLAKRRRIGRVLDVGTGSGVLAIAAAKALRAPVVASDIDARAVEAARANARLNRVAPFITLARDTSEMRRSLEEVFMHISMHYLRGRSVTDRQNLEDALSLSTMKGSLQAEMQIEMNVRYPKLTFSIPDGDPAYGLPGTSPELDAAFE
ncbi:MAG: 50S ribosomal protein L11 methyltransferase, partial [Pseudolabrys sp.]